MLYVAMLSDGLVLVTVLHHRMDPARRLPRAVKAIPK